MHLTVDSSYSCLNEPFAVVFAFLYYFKFFAFLLLLVISYSTCCEELPSKFVNNQQCFCGPINKPSRDYRMSSGNVVCLDSYFQTI